MGSVLGVTMMNGVIAQAARKHHLPLIDLAAVFDQAKDYANPIEPSVWGGDKISTNILLVLDTHDFARPSYCRYRRKTYSASEFDKGERGTTQYSREQSDASAALNAAPSAASSGYNERFRRWLEAGHGSVGIGDGLSRAGERERV